MAKTTEIQELANEVASQIKKNRRLVLQQAEQVIRAAVEEGRPLDYEEIEFLTAEAGFDRPRINTEMRRLNRVIQLQQRAGTTADRSKLVKHVEATAAEFASRGPELEAQIQQLQAERDKLEKASTTAQRRHEEVLAALDGLTKCVPATIAAANNAKRGTLKNTVGRELSEMQIDLAQIKLLVAGPVAGSRNPEFYWHSLQSFDRDLVVVTHDAGRQIRYSYSDKWPEAKAQLESELPKREADIQALETQLATELAALESELQVYWR
ncbi:MAG: hypothetical protein IT422_13880 [Pirellulaceae bacterium]|nr:hypothetical protein [Pirellulaceae bacterium]